MAQQDVSAGAAGPSVAAAGMTAAYPPAIRGWYVVIILLCAYTLSFIDRQILALMVDPIRTDLQISEVQISLLYGFAFALFYTILGLPLGWLADRTNRKGLICAGVTVWSLMTAVCGLARSFGVLFLARVGVGVGEATLSPAAYSIIADHFPKEKRARPMATYSMGTFIGTGLAFIFSGLIIGVVSAMPPVVLPVVGEMRPWQLVFIAVALPAVPVLALLATVREPARQELLVAEGASGAEPSAHAVSFRETAAYVLARRSVYFSIMLGVSIMGLIAYGYATWIPSHFLRNFGWTA